MKFASFASGSSGNCEYVGDGETGILVDAGISSKRMVEGLKSGGISPDEIDGILITHEHSDHIKGLYVFESKYRIPIYATEATLKEIEMRDTQGRIDTSLFVPIKPDHTFRCGNMDIMPFSTSHDAADPVCYRIDGESGSIGMATDLGVYDEYILSKLNMCNLLFIEANYDVAMLQTGRYPYVLKKRILGEYGHLSNDMCARMTLQLLGKNVKHVFLAHLSKENNYPLLAYQTVKCELLKEYGDISKFDIQTADRNDISCCVTL